MSSYFHTPIINRCVSTLHPDTAVASCHRQPAALILNGGPVMHHNKYSVMMMPSVQSFMKDSRHSDKSSMDICAVIRHHILDQVTRAAPLVTARPTAIKDVPVSNRVRSNPSYSVRGTKFVFYTSLCRLLDVLSFLYVAVKL